MTHNHPTTRLPIGSLLLMFLFATSLATAVAQESSQTTPSVAANGKKPNILFIAVDDLRPTLGCYGDEIAITPNIDALADRGTQFNRAYCQVAVCNPSRASLMTGLRPDTLGVWTLRVHFRESKPDAVTLPQWLRKSGYTAVSHGKIYHNPTPDPQSWSEAIRKLPRLPYPYPKGTRDKVQAVAAELPKKDWRKNNLRAFGSAAPDLLDNELLDGARTDMCIEDLRRLGKQDKPFFLAMGYIRPHLSFVAPKKYWDMYDPESLPVLSGEKTPAGAPDYAMHNNSEFRHYFDLMDLPAPWHKNELEPEIAQRLVHGYHACVSYVDAQIGRLIDALVEEDLSDNTIVVLWSDHGYKLGEYRGWGKMTNYEIDARVPLIIAAPGMRKTAGKSSDSLVELLDLFPTLCELSSVAVPDFAEGKSLVPVLQNPKARVHQATVNQYYRKHKGRELMGYSLRTDEYRYVQWRDFATGEEVAQELYDHSGEPESNLGHRETKNIADSVPTEVLNELSILLKSTHPPKKLDLVPTIHTRGSGVDRKPVGFTVENDLDGEIAVIQIGSRGQRMNHRNVSPGKSTTYSARVGDMFVVESVDGKVDEIHSASWPAKPVVISKPDQQ